MARLNWQRAKDRAQAHAAELDERAIESAFRQRRPSSRRPRRRLRGSLVRYQGSPAVLLEHAPTMPPQLGEWVGYKDAKRCSGGTGKVAAVVWSKEGRSLVTLAL